jgi:hypothetical protein
LSKNDFILRRKSLEEEQEEETSPRGAGVPGANGSERGCHSRNQEPAGGGGQNQNSSGSSSNEVKRTREDYFSAFKILRLCF